MKFFTLATISIFLLSLSSTSIFAAELVKAKSVTKAEINSLVSIDLASSMPALSLETQKSVNEQPELIVRHQEKSAQKNYAMAKQATKRSLAE